MHDGQCGGESGPETGFNARHPMWFWGTPDLGYFRTWCPYECSVLPNTLCECDGCRRDRLVILLEIRVSSLQPRKVRVWEEES